MQAQEAIQQANGQIQRLLAQRKLINHLDEPVNEDKALVGIDVLLRGVQVQIVRLRLALWAEAATRQTGVAGAGTQAG
jgi:hypothetical protein